MILQVRKFCGLAALAIIVLLLTQFLPTLKPHRRYFLKPLPDGETKAGFVVVLETSGQQGSGINAIRSLQCWAGTLSVPMNILEPEFHNTTIRTSLPNSGTSIRDSTQLMFSDVFDINQFNKEARNNLLPQLATRKQFYNKAPKKIVLVWNIGRREQKTEEIWPQKVSKASECLQPQQLAIGESELETYYASEIFKKQYCIVKVVLFGKSTFPQQIFTQEGVTQIYGQWSPTEVAVVLKSGVEPG